MSVPVSLNENDPELGPTLYIKLEGLDKCQTQKPEKQKCSQNDTAMDWLDCGL